MRERARELAGFMAAKSESGLGQAPSTGQGRYWIARSSRRTVAIRSSESVNALFARLRRISGQTACIGFRSGAYAGGWITVSPLCSAMNGARR